jgi:Protein of unknown function (DUF2855)
MTARAQLLVNRSSIGEVDIDHSEIGPLADDHVRLAIEHFALTANNVTYAQFGDFLDYWNFFPVSSEQGLVPAMGFARIVASNVAGLDVDTRYYGWFPMASSVDIRATVSSTGFRDDGAHRANHAAVYRSFLRTDLDGLYTQLEDEHRQELLRGLFMTGFLIDRFFAAENYLGATQAIVLSASSKTALGYAACAATQEHVRTVGVTSASNRAFVESTGLYDEIVTYGQLNDVSIEPSVLIDMSGAGATVAALHGRLGDQILHSMVVGKSHHDAPPAMVPAGPKPEMFFAPTAMDSSLSAWGPVEYARRTKEGLASFINASRSWLTVEEHVGASAVAEAWRALYGGSVDPSIGLIGVITEPS